MYVSLGNAACECVKHSMFGMYNMNIS